VTAHGLVVAARLVMRVQRRSGFPQVYFGIAILAVVVFRTLIPRELVPLAVPAFLFGEPGSLGILMVAAHRYMERGERSVVALAVTPLASRDYVLALILGSAVVPTLATAVIQAGVLGVDLRVALVIPPLFLIAVVSGSIGLMLSTVFTEFTRFILGTIPPITIYSLPLLSFFGLAPFWAFKWIPSDSALVIFGMLARDQINGLSYTGSLALLSLFAVLAVRAAIAAYSARVRNEIELA
jgi:hypothetical protein